MNSKAMKLPRTHFPGSSVNNIFKAKLLFRLEQCAIMVIIDWWFPSMYVHFSKFR
jgi:hypothetical protein